MKQMIFRTLIVLAAMFAAYLALHQPRWAIQYEAAAFLVGYAYWRIVYKGLIVRVLDRIEAVNFKD
jgi:hypothetical protein